jgi:hypothetical protein
MMSLYEIRTNSDYDCALQEVMQKITLAGLYLLVKQLFMEGHAFVSFIIQNGFQRIWTFHCSFRMKTLHWNHCSRLLTESLILWAAPLRSPEKQISKLANELISKLAN